jgi:hypothetical protein
MSTNIAKSKDILTHKRGLIVRFEYTMGREMASTVGCDGHKVMEAVMGERKILGQYKPRSYPWWE